MDVYRYGSVLTQQHESTATGTSQNEDLIQDSSFGTQDDG